MSETIVATEAVEEPAVAPAAEAVSDDQLIGMLWSTGPGARACS
ncbi:hypothetical protein AB0N14_39960 [Streptomyces sp. NPDC051104]